MASEYSLANVDTPLRWSTGFTFELPFGKGKKFLTNSKALDYAVGGWSANAISVSSVVLAAIAGALLCFGQFGWAAVAMVAASLAPERHGSNARDERQPGKPAEQLHQPGSLHHRAAGRVRQRGADAEYAGSGTGQLGPVDL